MKTILIHTFLIKIYLFFLLVPIDCYAKLIDLGNGVIEDDQGTPNVSEDDVFWIKDLSMFTNLNHLQRTLKISSLNNNGSKYASDLYSNWRLATFEEFDTLRKYGPTTIAEKFKQCCGYTDSYGNEHDYWYGIYATEEGYGAGGAYLLTTTDLGKVHKYWISGIAIYSNPYEEYDFGSWVVASSRSPRSRSDFLPVLNLLLNKRKK